MTSYTDKELLELAAKAVGINGQMIDVPTPYITYAKGVAGSYIKAVWSPLTDDGDALRLAVKLELDIVNIKDVKPFVTVWGDEVDDCDEHYGSEPYAATRRAIVRAAAAIGSKL